jgi:hypothetical protein
MAFEGNKMATRRLAASHRQWITQSVLESGWAPIAVFCLHVAMSRVFDAYRLFPGIDIPMHFLGGMVIAFFFHRASINGSQLKVLGAFHPLTHGLLVFSATCAATVFWEFAEFINDRYFAGHSQAGLVDTLRDMLMGILGGITLIIGMIPRVARIAAKKTEIANG